MNTENSLIGKVVAGCELISEIGRGNNGIVYLAKHQKLDKTVACKIIYPDLHEDPDFLDNLFMEASNAAKISHKNIIRALDAGTCEDGISYFMMEYVDGHSLEYIRKNSPQDISTDFLLYISIQIAETMEFVWDNYQMIHGDIKPDNIMICKNDFSVKIGDLGLARSSNGCTGDPSDIFLTPLYTAPEIIMGQGNIADQRSDIYSFGVMFYELICGTAPFTGTVDEIIQKHISETPEKLIVKNPDLDRELTDFIDSMLSKSPEERPENWKHVKETLLAIRYRLFADDQKQSGEKHNKILSHAVRDSKKNTAQDMRNTITKNKIAKHNSWDAENKNLKFYEKYPKMIPAALIILIILAILSLIFTM